MLSDLFTLLQSGHNLSRIMTQTPASRTTAVSAIDKEIDAVRWLIRSLLPRCNSLAPISTLPPKLLARIFQFLILEDDLARFGVPMSVWFNATHVCRHWRQVALEDFSLWARITVTESPSLDWISEMLVRSRNAPLDINLMGGLTPGLLSKFPPHIFHTRQLRLCGVRMHHFQRVKDICALEAPALEHFELGILAGSPVPFRQLAGPTLFKGQTPRLRKLILSQISIPWSHIPRGQLTELKINLFRMRSAPNNSGPDDSNQLVDLLINSPELKVLVLKFCLPPMLSQVTRGQPIHLLHLSHLCLGGSTPHVTSLLKKLKLPSSAVLHLRCISESPSTHDDHQILPLVSVHFQNPTPVEFKSFRVSFNCLEDRPTVMSSLERNYLDGRRLIPLDGYISFPQRSIQVATHELICEIPGVEFDGDRPDPFPFSLAVDLLSNPALLFVLPGRCLDGFCSIYPKLQDILEGRNPQQFQEAVRDMRSIQLFRLTLLEGEIVQRQLWRFQDLRSGGGLGFCVEIFLIALKHLLSASSLKLSQSALYTSTFRVITSDWRKYKHSLGTQKILLHIISSSCGLISTFNYPAYIIDELLVLVDNMLKGQTGPHIDLAVNRLRNLDPRLYQGPPDFPARALEAISQSRPFASSFS